MFYPLHIDRSFLVDIEPEPDHNTDDPNPLLSIYIQGSLGCPEVWPFIYWRSFPYKGQMNLSNYAHGPLLEAGRNHLLKTKWKAVQSVWREPKFPQTLVRPQRKLSPAYYPLSEDNIPALHSAPGLCASITFAVMKFELEHGFYGFNCQFCT